MKFAFINPGKNDDFAITAPLNLALLASILEQHDIETYIIDELAGDDVQKSLEYIKPDIVGVTCTTVQFEDAVKVAKISKSLGIFTILGGRHALIRPEDAMQYFDMVVQGEAEDVIVDIATGKIKDKIVKTNPIQDLNSYPDPAFHLLNMHFYAIARKRIPTSFLNFSPIDKRIGTMLTSRGCPFNCIFCHNSFRGLKYRELSSDRVLNQMTTLNERFNIQSIFFIDDDLLFNKKRVEEICDLILKNNIQMTWGCNSRVTDIKDDKILIKMRKAGCVQLMFGFESGSQKVLDILRKNARVEIAELAIKICHNAGMNVAGTFIVGTPGETSEDVEMTKEFMLKNNLDAVGTLIMTPYPGTEIWRWCMEKNFIPENFKWSDLNYSKMPIRTNDSMSVREIMRSYEEVKKIGDEINYKNNPDIQRFLGNPSGKNNPGDSIVEGIKMILKAGANKFK